MLFILLSSISTISFGQNNEFYYWYNGEKQPLQLKPDKTFLLLDHQADKTDLSNKLGVNRIDIEQIKKVELGASYKQSRTQLRNEYWTIIKAEPGQLDLPTGSITYHAPFFQTSSGIEVGLSHLFYVKLHKQQDKELLNELADKYQVEILGNDKFMPLWYTLSCDQHSLGNTLEMANLFYETGLFNAAVPDLMEDVLSSSNDPNDPFFEDQWNLDNSGQYGGTSGEDIQVLDAWQITQSHSNIILAVVDHGIEMNHPDLPNIHPASYDTESETSPAQVQGPHATAVSGIAGADSGNNEGIAGIAPQGQLMSISNHLDSNPGSRKARAGGINFAWKNGAHIINNSWGSGVQYPVIDEAIDSATTYGRGGLGTIVVFATGNANSSSISYPSNDPNVIAVGATSMCEERNSPTSCDTEYKWGSNYGNGLDVMAPGVLIPTTDRQGSTRYNPEIPIHTIDYSGGSILALNDEYSNQDYTIWFNGTSAAAPHVAGMASLILSINDNLTVQEVRDAIESTTEKIGNYTYTMGNGERQDLTWNNEMGYGRVNAYNTLIYTIENHGAHLGTEMSEVRLPLYDDLTLQEDVTLESGSNLTIESKSGTVTIAATSGTITIGGLGGASKIVGGNNSVDYGSDDGSGDTENPQTVPEAFVLSNNYPNPFNPTTVISYQLPEASQITLKVFDMLGREVATLINGMVSAGQHEVQFDASNLSSGLYIYRLQAGEFIQTKKMMLVK